MLKIARLHLPRARPMETTLSPQQTPSLYHTIESQVRRYSPQIRKDEDSMREVISRMGDKFFYLFLTPEKAYLFLGLIFGILFLMITPPFQVPDEPQHFYRAFHVSEGNI